jgi:polysaccharide biosynthesis/export protein
MREKIITSSFSYLSIVIGICLFGIPCFGQASDGSGANGNYKIGPGDLIDVSVSKNETLSRTGLRVNALGTVQLPMLDADVQAACLTERELADSIKERYRKYLVDPFVNVSVREFNANSVAVIGAVNSPGRFQLQRPIRLVELLSFVNGTTASAGNTADIMRSARRPYCDGAKLVTPTTGDDNLLSVSLVDAFGGGDKANPIIMAGDIVKVPAANQRNAYIQGNVRNSLTISLSEPVTLTQAIAMAGGTTAGAEIEKIKIRRQIPGSVNRDEMIANVKEINQRKKDDILLQPNDIIEIPGPTGAKKVFQDIWKTVIPSITQLPIRVIP